MNNKRIIILCIVLVALFGVVTVTHASTIDLEKEVDTLLQKITNILVLIASALMVISLVWGAILYMTSMGNEPQVEKAKSVVLYGIVGSIIIVSLGFIVGFLFVQLPKFLG